MERKYRHESGYNDLHKAIRNYGDAELTSLLSAIKKAPLV
jgi:uncharacterized protein YmfQ (DUF2313 family)